MGPIVLVHGAWHGGWCWTRVTPLLQASGRRVVSVTLTGLGDRAHLAGPDIGLATHVEDVVAVLEMEDLEDVVLVGHSLGGMVITGAAARAGARIRRLVYLDALVPQHGQSAFDLSSPGFRARVEKGAAEKGDGYKVAPIMQIFGVTDPADLAWMAERLKPQPIRTFSEAVDAPERFAPASYIHCLGGSFGGTVERCRAMDWPVAELDCGHDAMIIKPRELTELLIAGDGP